ncbi:MAG: sulfatase, partial [Phycisphaerales bacterium]
DDLGWMDTGCYGSTYFETPNIDRLASEGMRFTDAYAANPLCSPTRASIMTGKYPARLGITTPACHLPPRPKDAPVLAERARPSLKMICPESRRFLRLEEYTIGEAFRDAGYATGFIGKWHLGLAAQYHPGAQGFEFDLGAPNPGPPSYFSPYRMAKIKDGPEGEYITDRITDEALRYIEDNRHREFMLCFWHFAVHAPFQAKETITAEYRDRQDPRGVQKCAVMASMLQSLDESVGRMLDKLDELELTEDTIIVFTSDNGGNMYDVVEGNPPTNNHPLRGGKGTIYEGGTREPCIVVWPGVVRPSSRCSEIISSVDFYPTMLEMGGIAPKKGQVLDGESIVPLLRGTGKLAREAVFCHFPHYVPATGNLPSTYVRKGNWKLIRFYGEGVGRSNGCELYNLKEDLSEADNLADKMPEKVKELDALVDGFLADTGAVVPAKNPAYRPSVRGWWASGDCELAVKDGMLRLSCTGGDPYIHTSEMPGLAGPLTVMLRLRSQSSGIGQVFWTTRRVRRFGSRQRLNFEPVHDGRWREYEVKLTLGGALTGLRIDPCTARGIVDLDWVRLCDEAGRVVHAWQFD